MWDHELKVSVVFVPRCIELMTVVIVAIIRRSCRC